MRRSTSLAPPTCAAMAPSRARRPATCRKSRSSGWAAAPPVATAKRQQGADGEARRRGQRRLDRPGRQGARKCRARRGRGRRGRRARSAARPPGAPAGLEAAAHVDGGELAQLGGRLELELLPLLRQVGVLGIGLGMDRDVLAGGHRHARRPPGRRCRSGAGCSARRWPPPRRPGGSRSRRCRRWRRGPRRGASRRGRCGGVRSDGGNGAWGGILLPPSRRKRTPC